MGFAGRVLTGIALGALMMPVSTDDTGAREAHQGAAAGRQLVLGTQKGLLPQEMRVFLASLRAVACRAEVVIFSAEKGRADLEEVAETFDARLIQYDFESLSAQHGPMNLHRFQLFSEFLRQAGPDAYAQVCFFCLYYIACTCILYLCYLYTIFYPDACAQMCHF
jgi:hypothetical protein